METLLDEVKGGVVEGAQTWLSNEGDPISSLQESLSALVDGRFEGGAILKTVSDAAASDAWQEHVWEIFPCSFDEVVSTRIEQDQTKGIPPEFDPLSVARALNRMDAGVLIQTFGSTQKADKADVLKAITRIWISTLYPFNLNKELGT
ncbi:hypothetical protein [uncultured Ruegeria sp.]|uniref:hypothetical protein n=1 Tax=uncultured Ruegeria sp. TaxID=259304 RepID=UPI00345C3DA2